ncbi:hypothetical protein IFR04_007694 [Cadophora malorum]|uniref:DUF3445 domain-containing protein n=1 Tax=Cadophora malorum TaxID=108018 RepID=A0A8H7THW7_9HELO|nr:hypothetical protein IFR04_007694 [Cadophora malorum]
MPRAYRPWKAGKYNMTMGIRKMPEEDWLLIDNLYKKEQKTRVHLLQNNYEDVLQCLPAATEACKEALECIVKFLIRRYPAQFWLVNSKDGYVHNAITSKTFRFVEPYDQHPLAIAGQLAMEDINLLMQGTGDAVNEHFLQASCSFAPAGWYIQERIGWPLWKIHTPVPLWDVKLRKAMERFFLGMKVSNPVERNNYFVQTNDTMFQQEPFADSVERPPRIEDIRIRYERQTLRRLPRTGAVMFLVRTYMEPMADLATDLDTLYSLRSAINAWPAEMAKYKARHVWHETFEKWCDEVLGDYVPADEEKQA